MVCIRIKVLLPTGGYCVLCGVGALTVSFSAPGGVVTAGLAIYDTMQYILNPISTWCVGQAASMGSLLLAAGTSGMRHSLPNARIMVHQPSGGARVRKLGGVVCS